MGAIRVKRYMCSGPRDKFSLEEDVYEGWIILAAQTGAFAFAMTDEEESGEGADESKETAERSADAGSAAASGSTDAGAIGATVRAAANEDAGASSGSASASDDAKARAGAIGATVRPGANEDAGASSGSASASDDAKVSTSKDAEADVAEAGVEIEGADITESWDREGVAEFGELIVCPPGTTLWRRALEPMSFVFVEFVPFEGGRLPGIPSRGGKVRIRDVQRLGSSFAYLNALHDRRGGDTTLTSVSHLIDDLLFLIAHERETASRLREQRAVEPLMHHAAAYIEQHACSAGLSLGALADKLGIAGPQLTRRFQAAYGMAPVAYATEVRLARARRLLAESDATLDHIAEQCGYPNGFYLSRVFKRAMGASPSAYRRAHRI